MNKQDQWIIILLVTLIVIHVSVLITGLLNNKLVYWIPILNVAAGASLLIYWIVRQLQIQQHIYEFRETAVLGAELLIVGMGIYTMISKQWVSWVKVVQYTVFGIHLGVLVVVLIFMLCFKMNKMI